MSNTEQQQQKPNNAKPHLPHLEGYKSPASNRNILPKFVLNVLPDEITRWLPRNYRDIRRMRVSGKLWMFFIGRIRIQRVLGTIGVGLGSYLFICWLDGVSPYMALSEDPNTAFRHPYWIEKANEKTNREREMRRRIESQGDPNSAALEATMRSYSSHQASDRSA